MLMDRTMKSCFEWEDFTVGLEGKCNLSWASIIQMDLMDLRHTETLTDVGTELCFISDMG